VGGVIAAHLKEVEETITVTTLKEHDVAGGGPSILESGDISYGGRAGYGYEGTGTFATKVVAGAEIAIIIYPRGNASSMPIITHTGILTGLTRSLRRGQVTLENVTWEARTRVEATVV
jgi:hypothetical protein